MGPQPATKDARPVPTQKSTQDRRSAVNKPSGKDSSVEKMKGDKSEPSEIAEPQDKKAPKKPPKLGPRKPSQQAATTEQNEGSKDGEDLTTLLDESGRADLTLLIATAAESMRKLVEDGFDASAGLNRALLRKNMSEDEKFRSSDIDPGKADVVALDHERELQKQNEKQLSSQQMKDFKKDALKAFDEWRQAVIERVGQVLNSKRSVTAPPDQDAKAGKAQPQAPDQESLGKVLEKPTVQGQRLGFKDLYPPTKTPLTKISMKQRTLIVHSLLLLLLSLEHYNARSRVLLLHLTSSLKLPLKTFEQDEVTVAKGLLEAAKELSADPETKKRAEENKQSRKWRVGWATAAGAAVIGISGGYAAPLVSSGVGTIMGSLGLGTTAAAGYLGSLAGSTVLVGGLFGAYGGRMTGKMMDKYAREVDDFEFLPVHSRNKTSEKAQEGAKQATEHNHKLRVTICISGWLTEKEEVVRPWKVIGRGAEVFALKWELEALLNLGNAMNGLIQSAAWGYAQQQLVQQSVFAELMAAMWPVGLVKAAGVIDNPFSVAKDRSGKAGEVLADALINRAQGERPVTLIGYSLGARVIYVCLMSLARRKAFGLIESAVLIGAPTPSDVGDWRMMRTAVSARLINVYSENDKVLGFMYRTSSIQYGVAGLQKIEGLAGVENVNVSEDVSGHLRYRYLIGQVLKKIGFADIDMHAVEEEQLALEKMEEVEKKNSLRAQKNRLLRRHSTGKKENEAKEAEEEADEIQKQVADKTQKTLATKVVEYFYTPQKKSQKDLEQNLDNIQKAAADPGEAGAVALEALRDIQQSGMSYAQWAAQQLPALPGRGLSTSKATAESEKATSGTSKTAPKTADDATKSTSSYTQTAASYLPTFGGGAKKMSKAPEQAASNAAEGTKGLTNSKGVPGADTSVEKPLSDSKQAEKAAEESGTKAAASTQSYTSRAAGYLPSLSGVKGTSGKIPQGVGGGEKKPSTAASNATQDPTKAKEETADSAKGSAGKTGSSVADTPQTASDTAKSTQSYTTRAAGYIASFKAPSANVPSVGTNGKAEAATPGETGSPSPAATGRQPSGVSAAKEDEKGSKKGEGKDETKSTSPSYTSRATEYLPSVPSFGRGTSKAQPQAPSKPPAPDRTPSEVKKNAPKLGRKGSEVPSTSPSLSRQTSQAKKSSPQPE